MLDKRTFKMTKFLAKKLSDLIKWFSRTNKPNAITLVRIGIGKRKMVK